MRVSYEEMRNQFRRILLSRGFDDKGALAAAKVFADNSLDGIYTHGVNRFPRGVSYLDKGEIKPSNTATVEIIPGL